jgi:nucleotide-binding universal stress UspA family protein
MLGDRRIVACLDGSSCAERTVAPAQRWSQVLGLPLWLVQVAPSRAPAVDAARPGVRPARSAEALARSLRGVDGWQVVRGRDPARSLATVAETWPVAAFVMATHGRAGWTRVLKGSVTAATVRRARVPVLVVPAAVEAR